MPEEQENKKDTNDEINNKPINININNNNDFNLDLSLALHPLRYPSQQLPLKRKAFPDEESEPERCRKNTTSFWWNADKGQKQNGGFYCDGENSSSGFSDTYRSISHAGENSSDTSSNSSCHPVSSPAANLPTGVADPSVNKPVSSQDETHHLIHSNVNIIPKSNPTPCDKKCAALDKEPSTMPRSPSPSPKDAKVVLGKPPKPNRQMSQQSVLLPQMPCVSTTGNGPNGKTISGFLYKYSKTEVSIVCVCHGTSFSPAKFVEHAGGVDIEHPLKHIRVVPFALG